MAIPQDPHEILKERTRRVLMDNPPGPGIRSFVMGPPGESGLEPQGSPAPELTQSASEPAWTQPAHEPAWEQAAHEPAQPGSESVATVPGEEAAEHASAPHAEADRTAPHNESHRTAPHTEAAETTDYIALIQLRLSAIRSAQELHPKQVCAARRVRELSQSLAATASDSVHYRVILENLGQAHAEWLALEEQLWRANDAIRSTQWLVDLLAEPVIHTGV